MQLEGIKIKVRKKLTEVNGKYPSQSCDGLSNQKDEEESYLLFFFIFLFWYIKIWV